jgi:hypothetical protein
MRFESRPVFELTMDWSLTAPTPPSASADPAVVAV